MRYLMSRQHDGCGTRVADDRTRWSSALLLLLIFDLVFRSERVVMIHFRLRHVE